MYPVLATFGGFVLPTWHVFFVLSAMSSYVLLFHLFTHHEPKLVQHLNPLYVLAYVGGYWGARFFSLLIEEKHFKASDLLEHGSMTFYGGFLCSFCICGLYILWQKISFLRLLDLFMPSCLLGLAIGRIGCFLNGDDYGVPVISAPSPWWAVTFPDHEIPIPRVPVQLIESGSVALLLAFVLWNFTFFRKEVGRVGFVALGGYCVIRFLDEFLRDDDRGWIVEPILSPSQGVSLCVFGLLILWKIFKIVQRRHPLKIK